MVGHSYLIAISTTKAITHEVEYHGTLMASFVKRYRRAEMKLGHINY